MKVKALISALEATASPEADVVFVPESGDPIAIEGGIVGSRDGQLTILLAPLKLDKTGGF